MTKKEDNKQHPRKPLHQHEDEDLPEVTYIYDYADEESLDSKDADKELDEVSNNSKDNSQTLDDSISECYTNKKEANDEATLAETEISTRIDDSYQVNKKSEEDAPIDTDNEFNNIYGDDSSNSTTLPEGAMLHSTIKNDQQIDSDTPSKTTNDTQKVKNRFLENRKLSASKNFRLGIVGGKGVGKTYLFHSMVHRLQSAKEAGALSYFLKNSGAIKLHSAEDREAGASETEYSSFNQEYDTWERLAATKIETQRWHRLSIPYKTGIFGTSQGIMDVEFFDGAGEMFSAKSDTSYDYWKNNFSNISVIVFCLPLWAALPSRENKNTLARRQIIESFETVVSSFEKIRKDSKVNTPVKTILALTMADDAVKTSLGNTLITSWLEPYMLEDEDQEVDKSFFKKFKSGGVVNQYLANARKTSDLLNEMIEDGDRLSSSIPRRLKFGSGAPWIIPVSAIRGDFLEKIMSMDDKPDDHPLPDHNPAHVELPLLVALCEHTNAIM